MSLNTTAFLSNRFDAIFRACQGGGAEIFMAPPCGFMGEEFQRLSIEVQLSMLSIVSPFLRDYLRSLQVFFPRLVVRESDLLIPSMLSVRELVKWLKDLCTSPMARVLGSLEVCPWILPFKGRVRRYLQRCLGVGRARLKCVAFAQTVGQLKRVCPSLPDDYVDEELREHARVLTTESPMPKTFCCDLVTVAREILGTLIDPLPTWEEEIEMVLRGESRVPDCELVSGLSSSAGVGAPRGRGGIYGFFEENRDHRYVSGGYRREPKDFYKNWTGPGEFPGHLPIPPVGLSCRFFESSGTKIHTYVRRFPPSVPQLAELGDEFVKRFGTYRRDVVAIKEPLKVRTITVHEPFEAALFEPYSKKLQSALSRRPEILSGKEFDANEFYPLRDILRRNPDYVVVSDDASKATDGLSPELAVRLHEGFMSDELYRHLVASINNSTLEYSFSDGTAASFKQVNGQLMGARWSFGTLCVLHLACKRMFYDMHSVPYRDRFIRINGDDGLIVIPRSLLPEYARFTRQMWELNPLKSFVSRRFVSFNSQLFDLGSDFNVCPAKLASVPRIRFNLIAGIDKFGERMQNLTVFNTIVESAGGLSESPNLVHQLWSWFVCSPWRESLSYLDSFRRGNNWFLPLQAGGYGIRVPWDFHITPRQRAGVTVALRDSPDSKSRKRLPTRLVPRSQHPYRGRVHSWKVGVSSDTAPPEELAAPRGLKQKVDVLESGVRLRVGQLPRFKDSHVSSWDGLWDQRTGIDSISVFILQDEANTTNSTPFEAKGFKEDKGHPQGTNGRGVVERHELRAERCAERAVETGGPSA